MLMTERQYAFLCKVEEQKWLDEEELTNEERLVLNTCLHCHWVRFTPRCFRIVLTDAGCAALLMHRDLLAQQAQHKKKLDARQQQQRALEEKQRFEDLRANLATTCVGAVISSVLAFLIEYLGKITQLFEKILH